MRDKPFVANSGMKIKEPTSLSDREEKSPTPPDQPYYLSSSPPSECESLISLDPDSTAITLCHRNPELIISQSQLSPSDIVPPSPVFYHEANATPGVCVDRGNGSFSWSPAKISRSAVKIGIEDSSGASDIDIDDCLLLDYQPRDGVLWFEIETQEGVFWAPVAHRTRKRLKATHAS